MQRVFEILDNLKIDYKNYKHKAVFSCDDAKWIEVPWKRVKSLLLRNKKSTNFYMVILPDYKKLDVNIIRSFFDDTKLSFVSTEKMQELIKLTPWSVSPYALINNEEKNIKLLFDLELKWELIWFHPLRNDNTIVSKMEDVEKFLENLGFVYDYEEL